MELSHFVGLLCQPAALLCAHTSSSPLTTLCCMHQGGNPLDLSWWEPLDLEEVALDSFAGVTCFKVGPHVTEGPSSCCGWVRQY
jgi:hypothetical protein